MIRAAKERMECCTCKHNKSTGDWEHWTQTHTSEALENQTRQSKKALLLVVMWIQLQNEYIWNKIQVWALICSKWNAVQCGKWSKCAGTIKINTKQRSVNITGKVAQTLTKKKIEECKNKCCAGDCFVTTSSRDQLPLSRLAFSSKHHPAM